MKTVLFYKILFFLSLHFSSNIALAAGTCPNLSNQFDLAIPCVNYNDQSYQVELTQMGSQGAFSWQLGEISSSVNTGICATATDNLSIDLPCVTFNGDFYQATLNLSPVTDTELQSQWIVSSASQVATEPVLYIVSMMHVEDHVNFHENKPLFHSFASKLQAVTDLLKSHGGKVDFGPDWPFLKAAINFDLSLIPELLSSGHSVHTHAHETTRDSGTGIFYDLAVVNDLLAQAGAPGNRVANGGFIQEGPNGENWIGYVGSFKDPTDEPRFNIIVGYKNLDTQIPDNLNFIIRPTKTGNNWQTNSTDGKLLYAASNMAQVTKGGALDFSTIRTHLDSVLTNLVPGQINTLYWHDSLHNYTDDIEATERLAEWELFLTEYLDPLVVSGKVEWKTFSEMDALYRQQE